MMIMRKTRKFPTQQFVFFFVSQSDPGIRQPVQSHFGRFPPIREKTSISIDPESRIPGIPEFPGYLNPSFRANWGLDGQFVP